MSGFLRSKEFLVAAVLSTVLVVSGYAFGGVLLPAGSDRHCHVAPPPGSIVAPDGTDDRLVTASRPGVVTIEGAWNMAGNETLFLDACSAVGRIEVAPSPDATLTIQARLHLPGVDSAQLRADLVDVVATRSADGLHLAVDHEGLPERLGFFTSDSAFLSYVVRVPAGHDLDVRLRTHVGDIALSNLAPRELDLETGVGDIELTRMASLGPASLETRVGDIEGDLRTHDDLDAHADVGDVELRLEPAAGGDWTLATDVGNVELVALGSDDVAFDVRLVTDVGDARIRASGMSVDHDEDTPGATATGTSPGFDEAAVQVFVRGTTDVGNLDMRIDDR